MLLLQLRLRLLLRSWDWDLLNIIWNRRCLILSRSESLLLMFNHNSEPLLKVLLHPNSAPFEQILDSLDFRFQILQFIVLSLVVVLQLVDLNLKCIFFVSPHNLAIFVNHASECILFANLFDLIGEILYLSSCLINACSKVLASAVLFLEQSPILFHSLILTVTFPEHFEGLCSVC